MKTIRINVFETNSSSSHSLTLAMGQFKKPDLTGQNIILTGGENLGGKMKPIQIGRIKQIIS